MTVILADKQFIEYYAIDATKSGVVATVRPLDDFKLQVS